MIPPVGDVSAGLPRTTGLVSVTAGHAWPPHHRGHNVRSRSVWRQTHPEPVKRLCQNDISNSFNNITCEIFQRKFKFSQCFN